MHFGNSNFLVFFILIPIVIFFFYLSSKRKKELLSRFANPITQKKLILNTSPAARATKNLILLFSLVFVIFAAARPQWGKKLQIYEEKGLDIVVAMDVSKSMLAEDLSPNRIQRAKNALTTFINQMTGDRVGLVLFAGDSFVQCPLTSDYSALKMFVSMIDAGMIPHEGTNIASAIKESVSLFPKKAKSKVIVLITDGENLQGNLKAQLKKAKESNIVIYTIGVGTQRGAPIPITNNLSEKVYLKDRNGNIVLTKLDVSNLRMIAQETGGAFFQVSAGQTEIKIILSNIDKMEKEKISTHRYTQYKEQYRYFVLIALMLLAIEFLILERKKV